MLLIESEEMFGRRSYSHSKVFRGNRRRYFGFIIESQRGGEGPPGICSRFVLALGGFSCSQEEAGNSELLCEGYVGSSMEITEANVTNQHGIKLLTMPFNGTRILFPRYVFDFNVLYHITVGQLSTSLVLHCECNIPYQSSR